MQEIWLAPNRRAILLGCLPPLALAIAGGWLIADTNGVSASLWPWAGGVALGVGLVTIGLLMVQLRRPRIAFQNDSVLFYLRSGPPIAVPVDVVEAFFAGQSPAHLPVVIKQPQSVNLIARLSQRRTEWAEQTVKPALGQWCDSYVTIRGTWCEPLGGEVIRRLNHRLKEVKDNRQHAATHDQT